MVIDLSFKENLNLSFDIKLLFLLGSLGVSLNPIL